jgi:hypothetical protein
MVTFDKPVLGFNLGALQLKRNNGGNLLTGAQTLFTNDYINWALGGLTSLTSGDGVYTLTLIAKNPSIIDGALNLLAVDASDTWTVDSTPPDAPVIMAPTSPVFVNSNSFLVQGLNSCA